MCVSIINTTLSYSTCVALHERLHIDILFTLDFTSMRLGSYEGCDLDMMLVSTVRKCSTNLSSHCKQCCNGLTNSPQALKRLSSTLSRKTRTLKSIVYTAVTHYAQNDTIYSGKLGSVTGSNRWEYTSAILYCSHIPISRVSLQITSGSFRTFCACVQVQLRNVIRGRVT